MRNGFRLPIRALRLAILSLSLALIGCDDPVPGPIGGLILVVRSFPAKGKPDVKAIRSIELVTERVEVRHQATPDAPNTWLTVDTQPRTIVLANSVSDRLIAQYQVPPGFVNRIRILPKSITVHLQDGTDLPIRKHWLKDPQGNGVPAPADDPDDPVHNFGWKIFPVDDQPWPIQFDELTGVRALFGFDDLVQTNNGQSGSGKADKGNEHPEYMLKSVTRGELFAVNPAEGRPGIYANRLRVWFQDGTPRGRVDQINAEINATVLVHPEPDLSQEYTVRLPATINAEDAARFYGSKSEVKMVLPSLMYAAHSVSMPNDPANMLNQVSYLSISANQAWTDLCGVLASCVPTATAQKVGSRLVRVAVVDTGIDLAHPDLYKNIGIRFLAIPRDFRYLLRDTDGDGVIGMTDFDLSDPIHPNKDFAPADWNRNGYVDGLDIVHDPRWSNGTKDDEDDENDQVDDIVGYDLADHDADVTPGDEERAFHGTAVAGILGAVGDNAQGIAGTVWAVSIIPVRIGPADATDSVVQTQGLEYAVKARADLIVLASGLTLVPDDYDLSCGGDPNIQKVPADKLGDYRDAVKKRFNNFPFNYALDGPGPLFVLSAGNERLNIADEKVFQDPAEVLRDVEPDHVLIVGNSDLSSRARSSSYGSPVVDIYAPGQWTSLAPGGGTLDFVDGGTSAAASVVAGSAALLLAKDLQRPVSQRDFVVHPKRIKEQLLSTARRVLQITDGCGLNVVESMQPRVNAFNALQF